MDVELSKQEDKGNVPPTDQWRRRIICMGVSDLVLIQDASTTPLPFPSSTEMASSARPPFRLETNVLAAPKP